MVSNQGKWNPNKFTYKPPNLLLSAVRVTFGQDSFEAIKFPYPGNDEFKKLRQRYKDKWFLYRRSSEGEAKEIWAIPIASGMELKGEICKLKTSEHLNLLSALLRDRLPSLLPDLNLEFQGNGLRRIRTDRDLVAEAFKQMNQDIPLSLRAFHKYMKTEFSPRVISPRPGEGHVVLCIGFGKKHKIDASITELVANNLDVRGMWAIDLNEDAEDRLLGRIEEVKEGTVLFGGDTKCVSFGAEACVIEASLENFNDIFRQILDDKKTAYDAAEWEEQAKLMAAPGYLEILRRTSEWWSALPMLQLGLDIRCQFSGLVEIGNNGGYTTVTNFGQIQFCFDSDRSKKSTIPYKGLAEFGPFDQDIFDKKTPRILVVGPADVQSNIETFIKRFKDGLKPEGVERYANGFAGLYRLVNPTFSIISVDLNAKPGTFVGEKYRTAIEHHLSRVSYTYDAAIVLLKDEHAFVETENPYLFSKAYLLGQGIPVQEVRLSKLGKSPYDLQFIFGDIALALYAKLGGTPWTVMPAQTVAHEVVFGLGSAEVGGRIEAKRRYVGITTVFKSDGNYLLSACTKRCQYDDYPEALRLSVEEVLDGLKREQNWRPGETVRLVFHSFKPLRNTDIASIVTLATGKIGGDVLFEYAFLNVEETTPFLIIDEAQGGRERSVENIIGKRIKGIVGHHIPARGTSIEIGRQRRLLCLSGPELVKRHKEPLPHPLLIRLHPKSTFTDMTALTRQLFYFTGLSWRSMLPVSEPVTILYSKLIAGLINRLSTVPDWSPDMLNTKLRRSRWFL